MDRRTFIMQLLAVGLMSPSLKSYAVNLLPPLQEKQNAAELGGETVTDFGYCCEDAVIRVIGVGGGGCNALNHMIAEGVQHVEFIAIDTDAQALKHCKALTHLLIDADHINDLGAETMPDVVVGVDHARIASLLAGAQMVFIVAGMGGQTGTVVAPVVAHIARELDILTVAMVTEPFAYEVNHMYRANDGVKKLHDHVDSLIVVPNSRLMELLGSDIAEPEVFKAANSVLHGAVAGIAEFINVPGLIGVDFADVCAVMSENGMAMVGSAVASGPGRARVAAERAISSPLLEDVDMTNALGVLINITSTNQLKVREMEEVMACVQFAAEIATVILGSVFDDTMGDELRVTVVATGLGLPEEVYQEWRAAPNPAEHNGYEALLASGLLRRYLD